MVVVGLTGGIGSGKSTVARLLAARGALVVDADVIARQVVGSGGPAHEAVVARFGPGVLDGGDLDRRALAEIVFADRAAREDLNDIVHPAVREEMLAQVAALGAANPEGIVILDIPLLAESGRELYPVAGVLTVDAPVDLAIRRLVQKRGFTATEAQARIAAQATREERHAIADVVIDNSGDLEHLRAEVERAWAWVQALTERRP